MNINISLDNEQTDLLNGDIKDLISNLSEQQKTEILKEIIKDKFDTLYYEDYGWNGKRVSDFGNDLLDGLREVISKNVTSEIMENEDLRKVIDDTVASVKRYLPEIIEKAIIEKTLESICSTKNEVGSIAHRLYYDLQSSMQNRG